VRLARGLALRESHGVRAIGAVAARDSVHRESAVLHGGRRRKKLGARCRARRVGSVYSPNARPVGLGSQPEAVTAMKLILISLLLVSSLLWVRAARTQPTPPATLAYPIDQEQGTHAMPIKQKITTFLWYDDKAEEAVRFYCSIFKNSNVLSETRWGEGGPVPKGTLMTAKFQLEGQEFIALNGGPVFHFTEAISLMVECETQDEVDAYWNKLCADGGEPSQCGWLKDKYGLSWQIVPAALMQMLSDKDAAKSKRVMQAMLQMQKIDIARLKQAYDQR
jgi:predicted 3-demethylubiquinone-9 3-methyltransferase (glyoxalase superfamily)